MNKDVNESLYDYVARFDLAYAYMKIWSPYYLLGIYYMLDTEGMAVVLK